MTEPEVPLPEAAEEILRRRAESLAQQPDVDDASDCTTVLMFRLCDEWYAVRVADVREVLQEYAITRLPCVPEYVLGVSNVRGEILSVTDPARLMSLGAVSTQGPVVPPVVVVFDGTVATALAVDEVGDIVEIGSDDIRSPVSSVDRARGEFVEASAYVGDRIVGLMNTGRMLEPIVTVVRH
jgi:purine-binding chemotaxis protein CheW